jgi:tripartite-type tricarboxylate transporter receptor subunit TctC
MSSVSPVTGRIRRMSLGCASALLLVACGSSGGDPAAGPASSAAGGSCEGLEGKRVTLVVPFSPGGGYDTYARMVAPTYADKLGAQVIVQNQPGAGGLLALNKLLTAKPDGTTIAIMNGIGAGGAAIAEAEGVSFQLEQLSYIGRLAGDAQLIVAKAGGKYGSWDDVKAAQGFRFGSTGPGASDHVTPALLISVFGLDARLVSGFDGSSEVELALQQGNVDGMSGQVDSRQAAIASGDQQPLLTFDTERPEIAAQTPTILELSLDERQRRLVDAHLKLLTLGRPLVGPPDMEPAALACLRTALDQAVQDPGLLAETKKQKRPLNYLPGDELDKAVDELLKAPPDYVAVLKKAL